jgi:phage-related protein
VLTLTYTHTGGLPFAAGSIIKVTSMTDSTNNYTGMVLVGGSGTLSYINAGWDLGSAADTAGVITCLCPGWSTGCLFQPTYTSKIGTQNEAIITKLGDGYSQRSPLAVNTFSQSLNLVYQNRGKREVRAAQNFVEDHAGAYAFEILMPDQYLNNQPNQKYVAASIDVTPVSFERYDYQIPVSRVFEA